jgi:hypothetical protein
MLLYHRADWRSGNNVCLYSGMSSSVESKTCPNIGRQSWIIEENTELIDCLIICVKNKLFGSVKKTARTYAPTQYFRIVCNYGFLDLATSKSHVRYQLRRLTDMKICDLFLGFV